MKQTIEVDNINYIIDVYGRGNVLVGVDYLSEEDTGADLVIYNISGIEMEGVETFSDFTKRVSELGYDEECYEIDRFTLIKTNI